MNAQDLCKTVMADPEFVAFMGKATPEEKIEFANAYVLVARKVRRRSKASRTSQRRKPASDFWKGFGRN